jgi:stage V sporulation protein G
MEITEVRIKLMEDSDDRLQAFCSVTFDNAFVVRDLKIIDGTNGPFVAMPSRKLTSHCHQCGSKNHLKASYCNQCGARQRDDRLVRDAEGRAKLYADIAHPINCSCREMIQERLVAAYHDEVARSKLPGYVPSFFDYDNEEFTVSADDSFDSSAPRGKTSSAPASKPADAPPNNAGHQPRGPHKPPAREGNSAPRRSDSTGFGAGILE